MSTEQKKLSRDELLAAEAYFNVATLLGKAIQATAYHITHPDYEPDRIEWIGKPAAPPEEDEEEEAEEEDDFTEGVDSDRAADDSVIHSNEVSIDFQINQIMAMYTPGLFELLKPSALHAMFHLAMAQFDFDIESDDPSQEMSESDKQKAAIAWVIAKRVFAVRHPDEAILVVSLTERDFNDVRPIQFRPMDDTDKQFVVETCALIADDVEDKQADEEVILQKLQQLNHSDIISTPTSMAFWRQHDAAALKPTERGKKPPLKIPGVYSKPKNVDVYLVVDSEGKQIEITGFDKVVQSAIGQMWRENGSKPVESTPAEIFRRCAGLKPDASVSPQSVKATIDSLNKQRKAHVFISFGDQRDVFVKNTSPKNRAKDFDFSMTVIDGDLISADRKRDLIVAPNGKIVDDTYIFYRAPILEHYSHGFNQIATYDRECIAGALTKATPENIAFAHYIMVQINRMKHEKQKKKIPQEKTYTSRHTLLTFETIANRCVYDISNRAKLRNFQSKVFKYCQNLVTLGKVKAVEPAYEGRVYVGVKFTI